VARVAAWLGSFVLVVGAAFEAAYAEGVIETGSISGGVESVARFAGDATKPVEDIGYLGIAIGVVLAAGVASSLWASFVAGISSDSPGARFAYTFVSACFGTLIAGIVLGLATSIVFHDSPVLTIVYALPIAAMGALPGTIGLPLICALADRIERLVWSEAPRALS